MFQARKTTPDAEEGGTSWERCVCQATVAVVIAYPSRPIKGQLGELALGTAHTSCCGPIAGRDNPWART
ncbi:hypothetical protein BD413DRAFT_591226 [Trametes elegans]|nr:hypothetical protein BD413DRAFT_591226 [Trametes elegans]